MSETYAASAGSPSTSGDEIALGRLFGLLIDHKWLIIAVTLLFSLGGIVYVALATPIYQGDALVQVERRSNVSPLGDIRRVFGEGVEFSTAAEVQILTSRMVLSEVVERLGLDVQVAARDLPLLGDVLRRAGIKRPAFREGKAEVWAGERLSLGRLSVADYLRGQPLTLSVVDSQRYAVRLGDEPLGEGEVGTLAMLKDGDIQLRIAELEAPAGAEFTLVQRSRTSVARSLQSRLSVDEVGSGANASTGMLRLVMTGPDREQIRRTLNAVVEIFLTQNVERQSAEAQQSLEFLREQAPELRAQLTQAEEHLNEYRVAMDSVDLSSESQAAIGQFIALEQQLNDLELQEAELAQRFTPRHPSYQTLLRKKEQLQRERAELNERVSQLPAAQQEVVRLTRDVEVTQAIYVNVLNKTQELEVARAGAVGNVRIIDEALVGSGPIEPQALRIVVMATLLGGVLAVALVLMRGLLSRGVETPEQIEAANLPVYATVTLSEAQSRLVKRVRRRSERRSYEVTTGILAQQEPMDAATEALRGLRTSLYFAMLDAPNNRIAMIGPSPGIGKSFIAINLAAVCAEAGQKVLIIDADMRKGHVHYAFGGRSGSGLSDLLIGRAELPEVLRRSSIDGLDHVARGSAPPNPSELLMHENFHAFLDQVSQRYDLVIIDTPPILAVTDAAVVGKQCGTSLMVARFQKTPVRELLVAKRRMEAGGVTIKGVVLNAMERKAATVYGYGYYNYSYK
ncbi:MAG TPA: polysaccharide biosynthesis tyrosine autokinase [Halomonas sp.]|nr:polysaccharide biosynthesis tyrosine autokinase [Halomonas sp.]